MELEELIGGPIIKNLDIRELDNRGSTVLGNV